MSATGQMFGADADALDRAARELSAAADELDQSAHSLASSLGVLQWLGSVAVRFTDVWSSRHNPGLVRTAGFLRVHAEVLHRQAAEQRATSGADGGAGGFRVGPLTPAMAGVPSNATPAEVEAWWRGLSAEQQQALIAGSPQLIGNLNGVPFQDRYTANRDYMQQLLDAESSPDGPMHRLLKPFIGPDGEIDPTANIIVFDPAGDGRIAQVFGDIETASNIAVVVPGLNSTLSNFDGVRDSARALQSEAGAGTAVIAWTGYDAPNVSQVASDEMAKAGARDLTAFIGAVRQQSGGEVTLVGHSYGSLVVGEALKGGLRVDTAVFIGSPGVGVDSVHEFSPPGGANRYFAAEIPGDPVANLVHFGEAPTDPDFGAQVFDAGPGGSLAHRHSQYFDEGAGLDNLANIVTGGTPSSASADWMDYASEPIGDAYKGVERGVDWVQEHVDVPLIDDAIDSVVDLGQKGADVARSAVSGVVNTAADVVQQGAHKVAETAADVGNWAGDKARKAGDALTFWN